MDVESELLSVLAGSLSLRLRAPLENLLLAGARMFPPPIREAAPELDAAAAHWDQACCQLLRCADTLAAIAGWQTPPMENTDIPALVSALCLEAEALAGLSGVRLRWRCVPENHLCAAQPAALRTLLLHVLSNALKAAPETVWVETRLRGRQMLLSVRDDGRGIPESQMASLFTGCGPGPCLHGLGLPLCRRIAILHGGSLVAESVPLRGSCFTLSLPDRRLSGAAVPAPLSACSGLSEVLTALADALPAEAFLLCNQD